MARTSSITVPSMVGIVGRALAVDEKVWCFLSVFYHALEWWSLWYRNENAMKQYKFQNNYDVIA